MHNCPQQGVELLPRALFKVTLTAAAPRPRDWDRVGLEAGHMAKWRVKKQKLFAWGGEAWNLGLLVASDEVLRLCACESLQLCPPSAVNWGEKLLFLRTIDYCYY